MVTTLPQQIGKHSLSGHDNNDQFASDPETLRQGLEKAGMPLLVRYGGNLIGNGKLIFPEIVLNKIDIGMNDLMHADTCELKRNDQKVGIVELLCRITIKCDEMVSGSDERPKTCADLNSVINKQDIMFLMSTADPCAKHQELCNNVSESEEGDARLRLDIDRYRSMNSRVDPSTIEEPEPEVISCNVLRKVTDHYVDVIDSVAKKIKDLEPSFSPSREPAITRPSNEMGDMPSNFAGADCTIPIPVGDMEKQGIRFCPVCLYSMSWLPKYACCPNCGAKPMPVVKESSRTKLTASKILDEVLVKPQATLGAEDFCVDPCKVKLNEECPDEAKDTCSATRCTCKGGKICAHCRIRKLCEDIFAKKGDTNPHCPIVEPESDEDFCVIAETETDCRPYLVRVFSELRDLYQINDNKKAMEHQTRCTQSLMTMKSKRSIAAKLLSKSGKAASMGALTDKNYAGVPTKLGHKTCMNQNRTVSRRHGWNWTSSPQARRHGWRPGAIARPTSNVMKFFLDHETRKSVYNVCQKVLDQDMQRTRGHQPVLSVSKKNGETFITLRPLQTLGIEQHPIVFKIVKSDLAKALREIGRSLKDKGFAKCSCHQTLRLCTCRSDQDKQNLNRALIKECKKHQMPPCADQLVLTDTSESELEFNFEITPPAGTKKPIKRSKSRVVNRSTQTNKTDRNIKPQYPIDQSPYYRTFDCAVGDRYMGTAFGALTENVFEDGVFGYRGGGQHGQPPAPKNQKIWGPQPGAPLRIKNKKAWKDMSPSILNKMRKLKKK
ncbi:uncharacterized protein Dwil_GK10902 [Drosophila willistoni]|uniref:DUF4776 domain-containing protein n=1 Tax=Drosophila willistoni TaxID=7260 RepID=B4N9I7_DROWI|nr:uncharacterized protein Dwil_GK10902 [Drosophila willistoni]